MKQQSNIPAFEQEFLDINDRLEKMKATFEFMRVTKSFNHEVAMESQTFFPETKMPSLYYSNQSAAEKHRLALEDLSHGMLALIAAAAVAFGAMLAKFLGWFGGSSGGGNGGGGGDSNGSSAVEVTEAKIEKVEKAVKKKQDDQEYLDAKKKVTFPYFAMKHKEFTDFVDEVCQTAEENIKPFPPYITKAKDAVKKIIERFKSGNAIASGKVGSLTKSAIKMEVAAYFGNRDGVKSDEFLDFAIQGHLKRMEEWKQKKEQKLPEQEMTGKDILAKAEIVQENIQKNVDNLKKALGEIEDIKKYIDEYARETKRLDETEMTEDEKQITRMVYDWLRRHVLTNVVKRIQLFASAIREMEYALGVINSEI